MILAFAIIAMSGVVIGVIYSKFDVELKRSAQRPRHAATTSFARASCSWQRRSPGHRQHAETQVPHRPDQPDDYPHHLRPALFHQRHALPGRYQPAHGVESSHYGIMLRQRGWRPLPFDALANLQADLPGKNIVQHWWAVDASDTRDVVPHRRRRQCPVPPKDASLPAASNPSRAPVRRPADDTGAAALARGPHPDSGPARIFSARGILGLSPGESRLSPIANVLGPDFKELEDGKTQIIYLARQIADRLQVKRGEWVSVGGINLQVAGLYDSAEFDQRVLSLSGEPLAPLNYTSGELDTSGRRLDDSNSMQALELDCLPANRK